MSPFLHRATLSLWSAAYLLCESEHAFCRRLPSFLKSHVPDWPIDQTIAVDVGASVGVYAKALSAWCDRTIAVEANADLARQLERLRLPRTQIVNAAAGARAGRAFLVADQDRGRRPEARLATSGPWMQSCDVVTLDDLVHDPAALVCKIDVEGTEMAVLDGMTRLLSLKHIFLIIEIEDRHNPEGKEVFKRLQELGLNSFLASGSTLLPIDASHITKNTQYRSGRLARVNGYRPNVVFTRLAT